MSHPNTRLDAKMHNAAFDFVVGCRGVEWFRRENLYPHGVLYGIGCGGVSPVSLEKKIKMVLGFHL